MASLAEMIYGTAQDTVKNAGAGVAQSLHQGAQLALQREQLEQQKQQLQTQQQHLQLAKVDKAMDWFEKAQAMPEGAMKKAFINNYIPNGINALGLSDAFHPDSLKFAQADPALMAYVRNEVQENRMNPSDLYQAMGDPDKMASIAASPGFKAFGSQEAIKASLQDSIGQIVQAADIQAKNKAELERAEAAAKAMAMRQDKQLTHEDIKAGNTLKNSLSDKQRTEMAPIQKQQLEVTNAVAARDRALTALAQDKTGTTVSPQDLGTMVFSMLHSELGRVNETELDKMLGINGSAGRSEDMWVKYFQGGANPQVVQNVAKKLDTWAQGIDQMGAAKANSFATQILRSNELTAAQKSSLQEEMRSLNKPAFHRGIVNVHGTMMPYPIAKSFLAAHPEARAGLPPAVLKELED